jgi:type I restriction enzyme M protein
MLRKIIIDNYDNINCNNKILEISLDLFNRVTPFKLIDKYEAYQLLDNQWNIIASDIETLRIEGFEAARIVDPNMVIKKKDGREIEVQDGWIGHILPLELIQQHLLVKESNSVANLQASLNEIQEHFQEIISSFSEEDLSENYLNDDNTKFNKTELKKKVAFFQKEITTPEINTLRDYIKLIDNKGINKSMKLAFIEAHINDAEWSKITKSKDGTFTKTEVNKRISLLSSQYEFPEESLAYKLSKALHLMDKEKENKDALKLALDKLEAATLKSFKSLTYEQIREFLYLKLIEPLEKQLLSLPDKLFSDFTTKIIELNNKYGETLVDIDKTISESEKSLATLVDNLTGSDADMAGLREFQKLLRHE